MRLHGMVGIGALFVCTVLIFAAGSYPKVASSQTATTTPADEMEITEPEVLIDGMVDQSAPINLEPDLWYEIEGTPGGGTPRGDFVVGPGKVDITIPPGTSKTIIMTVTNRIGSERVFSFELEDTRGGDTPTESIKLMGSERSPYSIRDYISIGGDRVTLQHNQRARIPVTISVPAGAEPGGRYGSVLVKTVADDGNSNRDGVSPSSPIVARIGTLFFLTIPGEIDREGEFIDLTTVPNRSFFQKGPITLGMTFDNKGTMHLAPYGTVSVTNTFGQEVGYIEMDPWFVMPQSLRFREVVWEREGLLGRYTATVNINRSYDDIIDTRSVTFWVIPWTYIAGAFAILFFIIFTVRFIVKNFEFKRKSS